LWQFTQKTRGVNYDSAVSRFALEYLEHNFESFYWLLDVLKMNFDNKAVDLKILLDLVKKERWDFFELMDIFNRDSRLFFLEILKKETDYDWLRTLSAMMQTHLIKILFPEEIKAKGKLSKYDQSILNAAQRMNRVDAQYFLRFFSELEVMAKSSDVFLIDRIRLESRKT
jgi:hypothetical protein